MKTEIKNWKKHIERTRENSCASLDTLERLIDFIVEKDLYFEWAEYDAKTTLYNLNKELDNGSSNSR